MEWNNVLESVRLYGFPWRPDAIIREKLPSGSGRAKFKIDFAGYSGTAFDRRRRINMIKTPARGKEHAKWTAAGHVPAGSGLIICT